jgi:IS5 family transposase
MDSLLVLFCDVDDFCKLFLPVWNRQLLASGQKQRQRTRSLTMSEVMTILVAFHQSHYRDFKAYYCEQVLKSWRAEFPGLVSYTRFVEYIPSTLVPLIMYLRTCCLGQCTGLSFIDSTSLDVCLNQRIHTHKVFAGLAQRGKTSTGWFFGFKLHLVVNDRGEILQLCITPGNVDDRKPVPKLVKHLTGKLFGDKGYLSQPLAQSLRDLFNLQLITKLRKNMKNQLMTWTDRILLRRRAIVETIIDQLKNISQIEHSRHRSITNFFINVLCGLIAYSRRPLKPSLGLDVCLPLPA